MIKSHRLGLGFISLALIVSSSFGCDPSRKEKCEWYLVPEPAQINLVAEGWVSLCARNYVSNNQRCYLKATLDYAKALNGKTFRLSSMKIDDEGPFPREVLSVKACGPSEEERARLEKEAK